MKQDPLSTWMRKNKVREVRLERTTGQFVVLLMCGGPAGYADSIPEALEQAQAKNAEWLDVPPWEQAA